METQTARARILVVEDDVLNREVARRSLALLGLEADCAAGGARAGAALGRRAYDLIRLDSRMPGMDGSEALRRIRAAERDLGRAPSRVIAMTAEASRGLAGRLRGAGFDGYLAKPFRLEELRALVEIGPGAGS